MSWVIIQRKSFPRQPGRWYQVELAPFNRSVLNKICLLPGEDWTNSWTSVVSANEKNGASKYKKTKLSNFCEKCNFVKGNINQKRNTLYNIFAMKVVISGLNFVFRVFLLISYLF